MGNGFEALSAREKEALRLLLSGHDAKSIARELGRSVHTINERLRDARRKMGVSSSREAARLMAELERSSPEFLGNKHFGEVGRVTAAPRDERVDRAERPIRPLLWAIGGMLVTLIIVAAAALLFSGYGTGTAAPAEAKGSSASRPSSDTGESTARAWLALIDQSRWNESWDAAGPLIRREVSKDSWASIVRAAREPLGKVSSRTFQGAMRASTLPGAPAGDYSVLQFHTRFARKADGVETVTLARDGSHWRVSGYFIR